MYDVISWCFAGHKSEFDKIGKYVRLQDGQSDVFIVCENNGIRGFINSCPHRGFKLVNDNEGFWSNICGYHGIEFDKGRPINLIQLGFTEKSEKKLCLEEIDIEFCGEFIFYKTKDTILPSLKNSLSGLYDYFKEVSFLIDTKINDDSYDYDCSLPTAVENALDPLHLHLVHPETLNTLDLGDEKINEYESGLLFDHEIRNKRHFVGLNHLSKDLQGNGHQSYRSGYFFPYFFISSTFGLSYSIQTLYPKSQYVTLFRSRLYSAKLKDKKNEKTYKKFLDSTKILNQKVFIEDKEVCDRVNHTAFHIKGPVSDREKKVKWFRRKFKGVYDK